MIEQLRDDVVIALPPIFGRCEWGKGGWWPGHRCQALAARWVLRPMPNVMGPQGSNLAAGRFCDAHVDVHRQEWGS